MTFLAARALVAQIAAAAERLALVRDSPANTSYRAFNDDGFVIKHSGKLRDGDSIYVAPRSWHWLWPPQAPGHRRVLTRVPRAVDAADDEPLVLETLSVWPRAFVVRNFLSRGERRWLVERGKQTIEQPMSAAAAPQRAHDPSTTWLFVTEIGDEIDVINKRVAALLRIAHSEDYYEALVLERYKAGQRRDELEAYFDVETGLYSHMPMLAHGVNR